MKITKEMLDDYVSSKPWGDTFKKRVNKQKPLGMDYDKYVEFAAEKGSTIYIVLFCFILGAFNWPRYENDGKSYSWNEVHNEYVQWLRDTSALPEGRVPKPAVHNNEVNMPILDAGETKFLKSFLGSLNVEVTSVVKSIVPEDGKYQHLSIGYVDCYNGDAWFVLPEFKKNSMYKNMKTGKKYTPKELHLV